MTTVPLRPSRRAVLRGTVSVFAAAAVSSWPFGAPVAARTFPGAAGVTAGFAGPHLLQIEMTDSVLAVPPPVAVEPEDTRTTQLASNPRLGILGQLNGVSGRFSGSRNRTVPQLFFAWPRLMDGSEAVAFRGGLPGQDPRVSPADLETNWTVASNTAPDVRVVDVYRKTVPIGIARIDPSQWGVSKRHLVTLVLSRRIDDGERLTVTPPGMAPFAVTRDPSSVSHALHACHVGYAAQGPKKVYAGLWLGQNRIAQTLTTDGVLSETTVWTLRREGDGAAAASGTLTPVKPGTEPHADGVNFNGCDIHAADFSEVSAPGRYRLEIAGVGASVPFEIAPDPYAQVLRAAARWYYHQRSGIEIDPVHGEGRSRPRNGHPADGLSVQQTDVLLGRTSEGFRKEPYSPQLFASLPETDRTNPDAWGGWHDAGDWDRRIQHMDAICSMAEIIESFPACSELHLNIPESGKPFAAPEIRARKSSGDLGDGTTVLPDLIHEALWGISLWRRTQGPEGGIIGGVEYSSDGIGGSVSWNPVQRAFAYAEEEWAAYRFAEAAAKLGHVIAEICGDRVLGSALIAEAELAWRWAEAEVARTDSVLVEDERAAIKRARVPAAALIYRATGRQDARMVFEAHNPFLSGTDGGGAGLSRANVIEPAHDYLRAGREGRPVSEALTEAIGNWMQYAYLTGNRLGADYGLHSTDIYPWGISWARFGPGANWPARRFALKVAADGGFTPAIRDSVIEGLWYALGCNPSNVSFIQGFGQRDFSQVTTSDLDGEPYPPGTICYGTAAGALRPFEADRISGAVYPADVGAWPCYARIFECGSVIICAEHGMKANAMEWLFACATAWQSLIGTAE